MELNVDVVGFATGGNDFEVRHRHHIGSLAGRRTDYNLFFYYLYPLGLLELPFKNDFCSPILVFGINV